MTVTELTADAYFEPPDVEGEYLVDSTPKYLFLDEYSGVERSMLEFAQVEITDQSSGRSITRRELYWNNNWVSILHEYALTHEIFSEMIVELVEHDKKHSQILKIASDSNGPRIVMHTLTDLFASPEYIPSDLTREG